MAKKELATVSSGNALPAHLANYAKTSVGNIDRSDMIIPRVKLLQGISPEVETYDNAKSGMFWHTMAEMELGNKEEGLRFVPIIIRKSYVLWAPRGDERGILARAMDGEHWDVVDEFRVKPKMAGGKEVTWKTADTVKKSGLAEFGSSIPEDPKSAPAASLTYEILAFFPDYVEASPAVIINTRSSVKKAKQLISRIDMRPSAHFVQMYRATSQIEGVGSDKYNNYNYTADGFVDDKTAEKTAALYESLSQAKWASNDERDEQQADEGGSGVVGGKSGKF